MPVLVTDEHCRLAYEDSGTGGSTLLFIHGWAMSGRVWRYQREALSKDCRVITLDLQGHGASDSSVSGVTINDFAADIARFMISLDLKEITVVAWSMGVSVLLAALPAVRDRVSRLVLVGGTPVFTSRDDFPHGLHPDETRGMGLRLRRNYVRTMEEFFLQMFAEGELDLEEYRQIVKDIVKGGCLPEPPVALDSLEALASADLRPFLAAVTCPVLLIHGEEDRICSPYASRFMAEQIPDARIKLLDGIGHAPFLSRSDLFNRLIKEFAGICSPLADSGSLSAPDNKHPVSGIDRNRVRNSFSNQADEYTRYAQVQRRVAARFVDLLAEEQLRPRNILDIGCGTGLLLVSLGNLYPGAALSGIDLAPGMTEVTRENLKGRQLTDVRVGDAEQLPFFEREFDLVVSTSTFQWLEQLDTAFSEVHRVLADGGTFRFALFGARTLYELKDAYRAALCLTGRNSTDRSHSFLDCATVASALARSGFAGCRVSSEDETEFHPDVTALLRSLKKIGAGNASPEQVRSLAERRVMLTMMEIYREKHGRDEGIPATYEVIYGSGKKEPRG